MALGAKVVESLLEIKVKPWDKIFGMTSYLCLIRNHSGFDLVAGFNHIYLGHVTAIIIIRMAIRYKNNKHIIMF